MIAFIADNTRTKKVDILGREQITSGLTKGRGRRRSALSGTSFGATFYGDSKYFLTSFFISLYSHNSILICQCDSLLNFFIVFVYQYCKGKFGENKWLVQFIYIFCKPTLFHCWCFEGLPKLLRGGKINIRHGWHFC